MISIRNITKEEAEPFWKLRLQALLNHPEAFSASYEEAINQSMDSIRARIGESADNYILGAYTTAGELIGMAGFKREQSVKLRHKAMIWGVYVAPEYRQQRIGYKLLGEILHRAKQMNDLLQIHIGVVTVNEAAKTLYHSLGFETYGVEKNAVKVNNKLLDEELMAYYL